MEKEKNTVHETVEEKVAKKSIEESKEAKSDENKVTEAKTSEKKEELSDDEIIDINKEEKKASDNTSNVTSKTSRSASPKTTADFIKKQKKRKRTRKIVILLVTALAVVLIGLLIRNSIRKAKTAFEDFSANNIETATVEKKTLYDTKNATGTLYAIESKTLSTNLGTNVATIEKVTKKVGDHVKEGDDLVEFSTEGIEKTIAEIKEDIDIQKRKDAIDAEDSQRNYVYSYDTAANNLKSEAAKVDSALFDLHEACDAYGDAKRARDEIQADIDNLSDEEFRDKYGYVSKEEKLKNAQSSVDSAYKNQEQKQKAYNAAVESQAQVNSSQNNTLSSADSNYKKDQINSGQAVKQLERNLEKSIDSRDDYVVRATMSGIITEINVTEGNKFTSGNVLTIQDDSTFKAEVLVDEYDIPKVKRAYGEAENDGRYLKVVVKTDATGDTEYKGHVTRIDPTSTSTTSFTSTTSVSSNSVTTTSSIGSTANYKVTIVLDETSEDLMIGMSAKVAIVVDESPENSLCIPYNTVKEDENGRCIVRVMDENGDHNTMEDRFGNASGNDSSKSGKNKSDGKGSKGVNGIIVEVDGDDNGNDKNQKKDSIFDKLKGKDKEPAQQGRRYREVEVEKIFETDYYAAVVPKVDGALKEGDEVMVISDKASGNDIMAMFGGGMDGARRP